MTTHHLSYRHCRTCQGRRWLPDQAPAACPACGDQMVDMVLAVEVDVDLMAAAQNSGQLALPINDHEQLRLLEVD